MSPLRLSSSVRRQVNLGFGIGAVVLLLIGGVAAWSTVRSVAAARERRAVFERRTLIERLLGAVQDAETGHRGYLLTGDSMFLEPYEVVAGSFPGRIAAIRSLLPQRSDRGSSLDRLDSLVGTKVDELRETIELRRASRPEAAMVLVRSGAGKRTMMDFDFRNARPPGDEES